VLKEPDDILDDSQKTYRDYVEVAYNPGSKYYTGALYFAKRVIPQYGEAWSKAYRSAVKHVRENYPDPDNLPTLKNDYPPEAIFDESVEETYQRFCFAWTHSFFTQQTTFSTPRDWVLTIRNFESLLYPWIYYLPHEIEESLIDFTYDVRNIEDEIWPDVAAEAVYKTVTWYPEDDLQRQEVVDAIEKVKRDSNIYTSGPNELDDGSVELSMMYRYK
jgi:hypothetical protein